MLGRFHENLTLLFCIAALLALVIGRASEGPDFYASLAAYETAIERGDTRRAVRYGEAALRVSADHPLFDAPALARFKLELADLQARNGNSQRAAALVAEALGAFDPAVHAEEIAAARERLNGLERALADRGLRGTLSSAAREGS